MIQYLKSLAQPSILNVLKISIDIEYLEFNILQIFSILYPKHNIINIIYEKKSNISESFSYGIYTIHIYVVRFFILHIVV